MSEEPPRPIPAHGAEFYPGEGGIMWQRKAYYPADYAADLRNNRRLRLMLAEAWYEGSQSAYWDSEACDPPRYPSNPYLKGEDDE